MHRTLYTCWTLLMRLSVPDCRRISTKGLTAGFLRAAPRKWLPRNNRSRVPTERARREEQPEDQAIGAAAPGAFWKRVNGMKAAAIALMARTTAPPSARSASAASDRRTERACYARVERLEHARQELGRDDVAEARRACIVSVAMA